MPEPAPKVYEEGHVIQMFRPDKGAGGDIAVSPVPGPGWLGPGQRSTWEWHAVSGRHDA